MTVAREHLVPEVRTTVAGRVRLRRVVVTEDVQVTVRVRREELHVEHLPAHDAGVAGSDDGEPADEPFDGGTLVVDLHAEVPEVRLVTRVRERVHVHRDVQTAEQDVSADVRRERLRIGRSRSNDPADDG